MLRILISFVRHFPDLSCMVVVLPCFSVVRSLTSWYAFLLLFFLRHISTSWHWYPSLFCHLHLCPDLSFNLFIVFGSFWLASLFHQVSTLVTEIKDLGVTCQWWCVLGISLVRRCPLLSRLQVCVELPSPW